MLYVTLQEGGRWHRADLRSVIGGLRVGVICAVRYQRWVFDIVLLRMGRWPFRRVLRR